MSKFERARKYTEETKFVSFRLFPSEIEAIKKINNNRSEYIVDAIREKMAKENPEILNNLPSRTWK